MPHPAQNNCLAYHLSNSKLTIAAMEVYDKDPQGDKQKDT